MHCIGYSLIIQSFSSKNILNTFLNIYFLLRFVLLGVFNVFFKQNWCLKHYIPYKKYRRNRRKLRRARHFLNLLRPHVYKITEVPLYIKADVSHKASIFSKVTRPNFKSLFHIKCLADLQEFHMYDYYNFYSTIFTNMRNRRRKQTKQHFITPWRRLGFFYNLKHSLLVSLRHTLGFLGLKRATVKKQQMFVTTLSAASVLGYLWLFEYNVLLFLVKLNFSTSAYESLIMIRRSTVFRNTCTFNTKFDVVNPTDVIQVLLSRYMLLKLRLRLFTLMGFLVKLKVFFKQFYSRRRKGSRSTRLLKKNSFLSLAKPRHFKYIEVDYRSLSAILIPHKSNAIYYQHIYMLWVNYWNYRSLGWKLIT